MLSKTICAQDTNVATDQHETQPHQPFETATGSKEPPSSSATAATADHTLLLSSDDRKPNSSNTLEVIVETDAISETAKSDQGSVLEYDSLEHHADKQLPETAVATATATTSDETGSSPVRLGLCGGVEGGDGRCGKPRYNYEERIKSLYDCRRAYSYPATNYVVNGFGLADPILRNFAESDNADDSVVTVPATRSRSVSACSYISEISFKPYLFRRGGGGGGSDDTATKVLSSSSITSSLLLDRFSSKSTTTAFSRRSLISVSDRSSSVVLRLKNPYDVLNIDLRPHIVFKNRQSGDYEYDRTKNNSTSNNNNNNNNNNNTNDNILVTNVTSTDTVQRHRKLAAFESPDQTVLLKHNPNM